MFGFQPVSFAGDESEHAQPHAHFIWFFRRLLFDDQPVHKKRRLVGRRRRQTGGVDFIGAQRQTLEQPGSVGKGGGELKLQGDFGPAPGTRPREGNW